MFSTTIHKILCFMGPHKVQVIMFQSWIPFGTWVFFILEDLPTFLHAFPLPWVTEGIHLGNNICNLYDGMARDIRIKRATYISKNCDLVQEFFFSHPKSKLEANKIFNSHFTGSPIWDLFSPEAIMLENTWNVSFRRMYDLPMQTHRYLVEPVSGQEHVKKQLIKRFLSFIKQIEKSKKMLPIQLLNVIKYDTDPSQGAISGKYCYC